MEFGALEIIGLGQIGMLYGIFFRMGVMNAKQKHMEKQIHKLERKVA